MINIVAFDIGIKNFAFASTIITPIEDWGYVQNIGINDLTSGEYKNIYKNLVSYLNNFITLWENTDIFLIEQQLNMMNIQATKIACHVYAYFIHFFPSKIIYEYPSTYKTKYFAFFSPLHRDRKRFAIATVLEHYKENDPVLYDWIKNLPKQDDVCDCILMCITFSKSPLFKS